MRPSARSQTLWPMAALEQSLRRLGARAEGVRPNLTRTIMEHIANAEPSPTHDGRHPPSATPRAAATMAAVREAFRRRRLAHDHSRLQDFYIEHNLPAQAVASRRTMLDHLQSACRQWRLALGLAH